MKTFSDNSFANLFALALDATNPGRRLHRWEVAGIEWKRERLSHTGPAYSFRCEIHTVAKPASPPWRLMYVTEMWWDGAHAKAVRDTRWGKLMQGRKADVFAWFRTQAAKR